MYEEARAPPSRSAAPEGFAPGDYEVRHHGMSREEYLLYPLAVFLFVGFVLVVTFIVIPRHRFSKHENPYKEQLNGICQSPSCSRDAVYLNSLLSWDQVNPCHDFYAFVCRQWTGRYATPSPGSSVSADDDFASFLENKLYVRLQDDSSETSSNLRPIIDLHQKCMDTRRIEDDEWNPLLELMSLVFLEGFPLTPPVRKSLSVWRTAAKLLRKTGTAALLGIGVYSNPSTVHTDLVSIGLPDTLIHNDYIDISEAIRLYTSAAFAAMNALKKQYIPPSFTLSIIKFASDLEKLADIAPTENASRVNSLQSFPQLIIFLEEIFDDVRSTLYFGESTEVMIQPAVAVNRILQLADNTDLATVMNYLGVRLMIQVSPFIPHSGLTEFYSVLLYGKRRGNLPRWQLCLRATEKALFPLTNLAIVTDLSAHVSASGLYDLTSDIVAEFQNDIDTSPYFTEESRTIIRSILNTTRLLVARPGWLNDSVAIDAYVQTLPVKLASARNSLDAYVIYHERTFLASLARGSTQRWSRSAFSTDCWYEPNLDTIYVPLLVFNISRALDEGTDAIQLSRAGPRLMRCAFDALLFKTRASTGVHQRWLKGETETKLREVEACLDSREASQTTRFQRTRDVLAAHFSLGLFLKAVRRSRHPIALTLPQNRSVTQEQLFFIYLMLQSCEQSGGVENRAPSAGYDWNIALRNTKDFPAMFLCNAESPMNVQKKCLDV
ncbi:endothelin-converting enzyme 1 [Dermacentor silvarum]|uniref:endothelin-converting enzyme 1 n=1 Tax=Dermacentor silvarum TaxID=543639 RepID=UPI00189B8321|nr:endothelin-converting enzyme 1 [Dermacentor silvarum]